MTRLTPLAAALTDARIRIPLLQRACHMSQRTFFADQRSRAAAERGTYFNFVPKQK